MCGRFVGYRSLEEMRRQFRIDRVEAEISPNYNVAPTQEVLSIIREEDGNILRRLHWGLIPFWARDTSIGARMINARAETVAEKPAFRNAFRKRRCLIPADGFYEWKKEKSGKQPLLITLPDEAPFAFAGLWETWDEKGKADPIHSCTILTTEASRSIRDIHDRMPVILKADAHAEWLDPGRQDVDLVEILKSRTHTEFKARPVSKTVNSVKNNSRELIGQADEKR
ncbi:MAG: SOS response-associated peptidase [Desulfobacterales bacterium]